MVEESKVERRARERAEGYPDEASPLAGQAFHSERRKHRRRDAVRKMTGRGHGH